MGDMKLEVQRYRDTVARFEEAGRTFRKDPNLLRRFYDRRASPAIRGISIQPTINIFSPFAGEENTSIQGTLRADSDDAAFYIDSRVSASVDQSAIDSAVTAFSTISLPRLHALFGTESDIDGNGKVIVFFSDEVRIGSEELGFFRPIDLLPAEAGNLISNEGEILYVLIPDASNPVPLVNATVAHEMLHLINFSEKTLPLYTSSGGNLIDIEDVFLAEGMAHLAEDLVGWGTCTPLLTKFYLECLEHTSLAGSGSPVVAGKDFCETVAGSDDSLARRGGMTLFLLYLFQQQGGASYSATNAGDVTGGGITFLKKLASSADTGIENIQSSSARSFFNWYADFGALLALDNTDYLGRDPKYNYQPEVKDPLTDMTRNIRLRGTRIDIDGSSITLDGPLIQESATAGNSAAISRSLFLSGAHVLQLLAPANAQTVITLQGETNLDLGLSVIPLR